jgi:hypothetical protein
VSRNLEFADIAIGDTVRVVTTYTVGGYSVHVLTVQWVEGYSALVDYDRAKWAHGRFVLVGTDGHIHIDLVPDDETHKTTVYLIDRPNKESS